MKTYAMTMFRGFAIMLAAIAMIVCCTPDPLPEGNGGNPAEEDITDLVDSLENTFYKQARAMQLVLTGESVAVASCAVDEDGNFQVSFTNGASFSVLLDAEDAIADALTYVEEEGVRYWALYDGEGNAAAILDAEGSKVEFTSSVDVKVVDRKLCLKISESAYELGYQVSDKVQMFDCAPLYDDAGVIYAVEFDFGQEESEIVYVSEYAGLYFYLSDDQEKTAVSEMYVNRAGRATLAVVIPAEISWRPVVAEGFTVNVRKEGELTYVDVVASTETVFDGEQTLKAVAEDGSFVFAEVVLTDRQFHSLAVSVTDAVITPSTGIGKFAYGISLLSDFNEQQILELAAGLIAGTSETSTGNGVSVTAVARSFEEILGTSLDPEARYVLWAVVDGVLSQIEFGEIAVEIVVEDTSLLDADINVQVSGANSIFGGVMVKTSDLMTNILYQVNNLIYDPIAVEQKFEFVGSATDFPVVGENDGLFLPQTTYAVWVVPAVDGEYQYSEKDVVIKEFTTNSITEGGSLELTCGEPVVTPSTISFPLSCEGAEMIYYAYFDKSGGDRFTNAIFSDKDRFAEMISSDSDYRKGNYTAVVGNSVDAVGVNLNDEAATEYWMFAVAIDEEGRYGKVLCQKASTLALGYDTSISLAVETLDVTATKAKLQVTSTGGDLSDYIYWVGPLTDPFWIGLNYCNSTPTNAQKYMALNPVDSNITNVMRKYGDLAEDGTILIDNLTMETQYVFLIMERGQTYYSKIAYKLINTLSAELGQIVREGTDKWKAAKSALKFDWHKDSFDHPPHLMAYYSFDFSCPTDLTAYLFCAGRGFYEEFGFNKKEQFMIYIEEYSSRSIHKHHVGLDEKGNMISEPDYVKNGVKYEGQWSNYNDFYVHGSALYGAVTYFAQDSHKEGNCIAWADGKCDTYHAAQEKIAYYNTRAPYEEHAAAFGLVGQEAEYWADALYTFYGEYYKNAKPIIYINDGSPLYVVNAAANGVNDKGEVEDVVFVMLKDLQGNYYEPMMIDVPNYFEENE